MTHLRLEYKTRKQKWSRGNNKKWQIKRLKKMASLISFHRVRQTVQGWETLSLFHWSSMAMPVAGGGDDHLLSTVAETRHELVSVSFLHIYKASNVCVPLWKERGHQDLSLCQATCRLQKKAGELAFFPPTRLCSSQPPRPALRTGFRSVPLLSRRKKIGDPSKCADDQLPIRWQIFRGRHNQGSSEPVACRG